MSDGPFHFPRRERLGIILWTLLALLIWWLPQWYSEPELDYAFTAYEAPADSTYTAIPAAFAEPTTTDLRPFDPNTVSREELLAFGLSAGAAKGWVNYRRAAGEYADLAALRRVRAISKAELERVAPYLRFAPSEPKQEVAFAEWAPSSEAAMLPPEPEYFPFNPNTVTEAELLRLGLTEREATSFQRYRRAGAEFRTERDWLRIRSVTDDKLRTLLPYLEFPGTAASDKPVGRDLPRKSPAAPAPIDINRAGPADWQQLPGIGTYWSGRILAFRRALGGFVRAAQVAETRGLPDSVFQRIQPYLQADSPVAPIPINRASEKDLARHPYISRRQATVLIAFRTQRGSLTAADFNNFKAMKATDRERLRPYLSFD